MKADDPRHGKYAGAIAHWKTNTTLCDPCQVAALRTRKANALKAHRGEPATVELGEVAYKILHETPRNILVAATGMPHPQLLRIEQRGPTGRIHRTTRDRILTANAATWTPIGVQRRLQALTALGWSMQAIATAYNIDRDALSRLRRRTNTKHVRIAFAERVIAIYTDLEMKLPPTGASATETHNEAKRRGYLPPLAWDNIDDPAERPRRGGERTKDDIDPTVVERFLRRDITPGLWATQAEKREIVRRWDGSLAELERMTGWKPERYYRRGAA